jgi:hypothetical protein
MYTVLSILWILLVYHIIEKGPETAGTLSEGSSLTDI